MNALQDLVRRMLELGASDLHLTPGHPPLFRVDGEILRPAGEAPLDAARCREVVFEAALEANRNELERHGDSDFAVELPGLGRLRANVFQDRSGTCGVFRLIPSVVRSFDELELPTVVRDLCRLSKGLIVVTGPTGSGKSTTLASMIDHINTQRSEHIITIEDPIEFVHASKRCLIHQREMHRDTGSFKRALRAALREDPDIILVGEMRDLETIEIAIETAETGHLVFGTLHTTTAASTVDRIIDSFPADRQAQIRSMLSSSLKGVIAQTLCRRVPKGRVAAYEILVATTAIANNIREGKTHQIPAAIQLGGQQGMRTLNDSLLALVKRSVIEPGEAWRAAVDKSDLVAKLAALGFKLKEPAALDPTGTIRPVPV